MTSVDQGFLSSAVVFLVLLATVVGLLWLLLPFAVFGIKPLMREILEQQRRTNELLQQAAERAHALQPQPGRHAIEAPLRSPAQDAELKRRLDAL